MRGMSCEGIESPARSSKASRLVGGASMERSLTCVTVLTLSIQQPDAEFNCIIAPVWGQCGVGRTALSSFHGHTRLSSPKRSTAAQNRWTATISRGQATHPGPWLANRRMGLCAVPTLAACPPHLALTARTAIIARALRSLARLPRPKEACPGMLPADHA